MDSNGYTATTFFELSNAPHPCISTGSQSDVCWFSYNHDNVLSPIPLAAYKASLKNLQ